MLHCDKQSSLKIVLPFLLLGWWQTPVLI